MSRQILTEQEKIKRKQIRLEAAKAIKAAERTHTTDRVKELISSLQKDIKGKRLDRDKVTRITEELGKLGFQYDDKKFPALPGPDKFKDTSKEAPETLAEAMLWKLVRWKAYKNFAANFENAGMRPTKHTDVVLFAFAKHLRNREYPIYDQHSLRALWACGELDDGEKDTCKSVLFDTKGKWKDAGSGKNCIKAYELFCEHIRRLAGSKGGVTKEQMDRLLMPLGQAIKKIAKSYEEFLNLCSAEYRRP